MPPPPLPQIEMLYLTTAALSFAGASMMAPTQQRVQPMQMIFGLGKKSATSTMSGKVVDTKTLVKKLGVPVKGPNEPITMDEVEVLQAAWSTAITSISGALDGGDIVDTAGTAAGELYGYGKSNVLFKPTKATAHPFRPTPEDAMSYFVGAEAMNNDTFKGEDAGFAINGGKGWESCVYDNHQVELKGGMGIAMGNYYFTCATTGDKAKVEYTFGYVRCDDGKVRIFLHHSSVPYAA